MRKMLGGLFVLGLLLLAAVPTWAQDATPLPGLTPTFVPTPGASNQPLYPNFYEAIRATNICADELFEANRALFSPQDLALIEASSINNMLWIALPMGSEIPPHEACYDKLIIDQMAMPQVELEHNICMEEYYPLMMGSSGTQGNKVEVYLRKDALPCINETGQRLTYFDEDGNYLETPVYSAVPLINVPQSLDLADWGYCLGDLEQANPALFNYRTVNLNGLAQGMRLFLPADARRCDVITPPDSKSLYQLSQQFNICMETLLDASGVSLFPSQWAVPRLSVPTNATPCYDEAGQRIGHTDRETYTPQLGESFLDIARAHSVCLDTLWEANPVMDHWTGWLYALPPVVFIPDVPPCEGRTTYTTRAHQTPHTISLLTNTCINRLIDANPSLAVWWLETLPRGELLTIPERLHCYDLSDPTGGLKMQPYVCYAAPITPDADFTNHEPAITASADTDLPYCYPRTNDMTVFYENVPYTLYKMRGYETAIIMEQCFGVSVASMYEVQTHVAPWETRPAYAASTGYVLIPQPHADCALLGVDDATHRQIYTQMTYQAGSLQDGVYTVNYQDTLSSIGHTYGYLPQSIADTNGLTDPNTIYYLQQLKLPPYPSLYTLAPIGGVAGALALIGGAAYGLRRWSRSRGKGKKKNS